MPTAVVGPDAYLYATNLRTGMSRKSQRDWPRDHCRARGQKRDEVHAGLGAKVCSHLPVVLELKNDGGSRENSEKGINQATLSGLLP